MTIMSWDDKITDCPERLQSALTSQATPSPRDFIKSNRKRQNSDQDNDADSRVGEAVHSELSACDMKSPPKRARKPKSAKRCAQCNRKLMLAMTFACRCGYRFCGEHRYPESHECTFDYRALGRQELAKNNPLIRPDKLMKF